jgi:hypothetical protein
MRWWRRCSTVVAVCGLLLATSVLAADEEPSERATYQEDTIIQEIAQFFGKSTESVAKVVERAFQDLGEPNGYIKGEEVSGAVAVGVRYGSGVLLMKRGGRCRVYWKGPSIGFDVGGNASKVFVLAYNLQELDDIYRHFPGVNGSLYVVAGMGINYQRSGDVTLAPIRLGVGLRAGVNVGYMHYTRERSWMPF